MRLGKTGLASLPKEKEDMRARCGTGWKDRGGRGEAAHRCARVVCSRAAGGRAVCGAERHWGGSRLLGAW